MEKNTFLFFFFPHLKWKCIECFAEKYLEGTVGCWIFVIQLALCSRNEFWDELSVVVSPLTFQRYAAFEPWIYCNLFFFLLLMCGWVMNCKLASLPFSLAVPYQKPWGHGAEADPIIVFLYIHIYIVTHKPQLLALVCLWNYTRPLFHHLECVNLSTGSLFPPTMQPILTETCNRLWVMTHWIMGKETNEKNETLAGESNFKAAAESTATV